MNIKKVIELARKNYWISGQDAIDAGDPCAAYEHMLTERSFSVIDDIDALREDFIDGNWSLNQAFIHKCLCFINQVNGGDEWLTIKELDNGNLIAFESVSFIPIIKNGEYYEYMERLLNATEEQCEHLTY